MLFLNMSTCRRDDSKVRYTSSSSYSSRFFAAFPSSFTFFWLTSASCSLHCFRWTHHQTNWWLHRSNFDIHINWIWLRPIHSLEEHVKEFNGRNVCDRKIVPSAHNGSLRRNKVQTDRDCTRSVPVHWWEETHPEEAKWLSVCKSGLKKALK